MSAYNRILDRLGRLVLPREYREQLGWEEGQSLRVSLLPGTRILQLEESRPQCVICGNADPDHRLYELSNGLICAHCLQQISEIHTKSESHS